MSIWSKVGLFTNIHKNICNIKDPINTRSDYGKWKRWFSKLVLFAKNLDYQYMAHKGASIYTFGYTKKWF